MATEDVLDQDAGAGDEPAEPQYITKDELAARDAEWRERLDEERQTNQRLLSALESGALNRGGYVPQAPAGPDPDLPSDDDDEQTRIDKAVRRALKPVVAEFNQFRSVGLGTLSKISERQVTPNLKYYDRFKKEIDNYLAQADPATRAQPESIVLAYNAVVGQHSAELIQEAIDADRKGVVREGVNPGAPPPRSGRGGLPPAKGSDVPSPADLGYTEGQIAAIEARGGPDAFARRMSGGRYKGWADYAKAHAKMNGKAEPETK